MINYCHLDTRARTRARAYWLTRLYCLMMCDESESDISWVISCAVMMCGARDPVVPAVPG